MNFDITKIASIELSLKCEFYDSEKKQNREELYKLGTDKKVRKLLIECLETTIKYFPSPIDSCPQFEISEKYNDQDKFKVKSSDHAAMAGLFEEHAIENVYLDDLSDKGIAYYRVSFIDTNNNKIIGIRRASYFKSLLKNKKRLVLLVDDTVTAFEDNIFKLDNDFDFIFYEDHIYIMRPRAFEQMALSGEEVTREALQKLDALKQSIPFINFDNVERVARQSKRAARLVFAVASREGIENIEQSKISWYAGNSNVPLHEENGVISPQEGYELEFLEVLDRRIYNVELIDGEMENYRALSRQRR